MRDDNLSRAEAQDRARTVSNLSYEVFLDLTTGVSPEPGPNGKVWRIRFSAAGEPLPPEVVLDGLAYPDGVAVAAGTAPSPR